MRRLRLPLVVLIFLNVWILPSTGQEKISWANKFFTGKSESPPPIILHDFGTLPKGTIKTYRFEMTNIYSVTMQVQEPKPTCGCVSVVEYTGKLGPLQKGHIDIKLDTSRVDGYKSVQLPVKFEGRDAQSGEAFWSYATLEVRTVSRPDIAITPGAIQFGTVPMGEKSTQAFTVTYSGRQRDWKLTEFSARKELLDVEIVQVPGRSGTSFQATVTLRKDAPAGNFDEQIVLKTNDPASPTLSVSVSGMVQAPLSLVPGDLMKMGGVPVGKKLEKNVIVRADKPFRLEEITGQGEGVSVGLLKLPAAKSQVVTVTFAPEKVGPVKRVLTIKTDRGESIDLTVEGIGTDSQ